MVILHFFVGTIQRILWRDLNINYIKYKIIYRKYQKNLFDLESTESTDIYHFINQVFQEYVIYHFIIKNIYYL